MTLPDRTLADDATEHLTDHTFLHDLYHDERPAEVLYVESGESVQDAYDALPNSDTTGRGGVIILGPGGHDVGAGLNLDRRKPVVLTSHGKWWRLADLMGESDLYGHMKNLAYLYTSGSPTALVNTNAPVSDTNGFGFVFENLLFLIGPAGVKYGIQAPAMCNTLVRSCGFVAVGDTADEDAVGVYTYPDATLGNDASWWRIEDSFSFLMALAQFGRPTASGNSNRHRVTGCMVDGWGKANTTQKPGIAFYGDHGSSVRDVTMQDLEIGVYFGLGDTANSKHTRVSGLAGEGVATWVKVDSATACTFEVEGSSAPVAGDKLVHITSLDSFNNLSILNSLTNAGGLYDIDAYQDDTTYEQNFVIAPSGINGRAIIRLNGIIAMNGAPEGVVKGQTGDQYHRLDGPPWTYIKMTGYATDTGWVAESYGAADSGGAGFKVLRVPN